ncbi:MAG TPA: multidrug ABC transporter permease [Rhodospirillaceae bacterium]|jgi:ABC-2 type transport system permease protein|nr:ABC transporter permease [Alphaproteobacteria bacterium]HBH26500.1 multidrug ABC transporter permease [Rhodospirillaceae bacterium]
MGALNGLGLKTLIQREVGRFANVWVQTVAAPVVTTALFYAVFALALGGGGRGPEFLAFLAPGLVMMVMAQNAFANATSSLIIAKMQGNIVDILIAPLSPAELCAGYVVGAVARGLAVGLAASCALSLFAPVGLHSLGTVLLFAVLGTTMMGALGLLAGLWAEKFDHMAAITNFIVTPLTFLSGTFYELHRLPPFWQDLALWNPFFYMIDGFRAGFTGTPEGALAFGAAYLAAICVGLLLAAWALIRSGYKIKP